MTQSTPDEALAASRTTVPFTVRLPAELADALRNYAFVTETPANEIMKRALIDYLKVHGRTDMVRVAFERALNRHAVAFDKLADL